MKRSEINALIHDAGQSFEAHGWVLPPHPRWDVTDFGLGDWRRWGLVLINLAEEPEYCEKLMYARRGMVTPAHYHQRKKEDIAVRWGALTIQVWSPTPEAPVGINGRAMTVASGTSIVLSAGERITLIPGIRHEFQPASDECILGEISTANDDAGDNFFLNPEVGRFPGIEEDEPPVVRLLNE